MTYTKKTEAILLKYGLYHDMMCDEIVELIHQAVAEGKEFNVYKERVRQLKTKEINRLKKF